MLGYLNFTDFNRHVDPSSHIDTCMFTSQHLPIFKLTEFFQKYLRNPDSAKSFIYPVFRPTGHQLISCNVHLNMALGLSDLWIVAVVEGNV